MKGWLTDLRKTALLAAIGTIVGLVLGVTSPVTAQQFARARSGLSQPNFAYVALAFALVVALPLIAVAVGFLVALYRTKTVVHIPDRLRILAWLTAAATICLAIWSRQFYFTQAGLAYLKTPGAILRFVPAFLVDLAGILFLVAIASHPDDAVDAEPQDDRLLRRLAKTGTIIWGIILVGIIWATGYTAFYYRDMQHQFFQNLQAFVPLSTLMWEKLRDFLQQAIIFVPFFVIHRGFVERRRPKAEASVPDAIGFDTPENPVDRA